MIEQTMNNNEYKYFNFKNKIDDSPKLLTKEEIDKIKLNPTDEYYTSIFRYNNEHKNIYQNHGVNKYTGEPCPSVKGTKFHNVVTDKLVWDFDDGENPENAKSDTLELAHRLHSTYGIDGDDMQVYFSGNRGFHLELKLNRTIDQEQFKSITTSLIEGLKSYDYSVNDPPRLLRLERTTNLKTGLYKIPLHIGELEDLSIEEIKNLAKTPRNDYTQEIKQVSLPENLFIKKEKKKVKQNQDVTKFDARSVPKGWKVYKWALAEGQFEPGERHNALMVIAATARALGYPKEKAYYMCKDALEKQSKRTGQPVDNKDELWENIIEGSIYADGWEGGAYSPQNNPWLKSYCERMGFATERENEDDKIYQLHDIETEFID